MRNIHFVFLVLIEFDSIGRCAILLLMERFEICLSSQYYFILALLYIPWRGFPAPSLPQI